MKDDKKTKTNVRSKKAHSLQINKIKGINVHQKVNIVNAYPKTSTIKIDALESSSKRALVSKALLKTKSVEANKVPVNKPDRGKILNNIREILKWSNATPLRCLGSNGYRCCYCDDQYPEPKNLKEHTLASHRSEDTSCFSKSHDISVFHVKMDITKLHCRICSLNIDTLDQMMQHLHRDHDKKLFNINNYMVPFKFDSDLLQCFICLNKFNKFKILLEHMNTHCRNFVCKVCDAGYITRHGLSAHLKSHETGTFSCQICEKVFNTFERKKCREKYVHTGAMVNKCNHCNESFKDYHKKLKHLLDIHNVAPVKLKCHACDRTFTSQKSYMDHTKRDHLMERRFKCTQCEMSFYTSFELKHHKVKHTGLRKFQCDVCMKSYGRKCTLREHIRIHSNDRRLKCVHCGVAFVQRCSWRGHMRNKHGEQV